MVTQETNRKSIKQNGKKNNCMDNSSDKLAKYHTRGPGHDLDKGNS